jgi:tellurite resistance protein TehA-like permease
VRSRRLLALVGIALILLLAPELGLAWSAPFSSFSFQSGGAPALLVLRFGVLVLTLSTLRDAPLRAAVAIGLLVLSLSLCGALYPFLIGCACTLAVRQAPREADRTAYVVLYGSLLTALALSALPHLKREAHATDPTDAPGMVAYWQARRNPYQARWWALTWTHHEANAPGDAYLSLATLDRQLGRDAQATKVLAKVLDHPASDAVRTRAESLRSAWDQEPAAP